ncbi:MAG TPA: transporter, partial [Blastocatellia bacterium]|nr:transporter [Blastocatellia bacterium]
MQLTKIIRNGLIAAVLLLLSGVVALGQTDPNAEEWARTQMSSTVQGGTGLFNTLSPRLLRRGEMTFGIFYNNVKRDPGTLDINTIPINLTVGLGDGFEAFINANFFQQVTSRQPFLLSGPGFSIPRLLGLPTIAFFGPPVTGSGGAAFFPGSFSPRGGILPALSSPLSPGSILVKVPLPGYFNDVPFAPGLRRIDPNNPANDQFQNSANGMGDISVGVKYNLVNPDRGRYGLAAIGQIYFPTASNFAALSKGRGTGEIDYGVTLAASEEYYGHRLRFMENLGYTKKGDPDAGGIKILDLADEVNLSGGVSYALTRHIETVTELVGTVFVGGATPDYNRVNPLDYQTGARFYFMNGRVSFGGAYRV